MALLEASGIGKNFGETHVLKDISLDLEQGEALAIIGSSGSGKTTLLRCLNFLERPDTGVIKVNGETMWDAADPATQKDSEIRKKRLQFGLVFLNFNLFRDLLQLTLLSFNSSLSIRQFILSALKVLTKFSDFDFLFDFAFLRAFEVIQNVCQLLFRFLESGLSQRQLLLVIR